MPTNAASAAQPFLCPSAQPCQCMRRGEQLVYTEWGSPPYLAWLQCHTMSRLLDRLLLWTSHIPAADQCDVHHRIRDFTTLGKQEIPALCNPAALVSPSLQRQHVHHQDRPQGRWPVLPCISPSSQPTSGFGANNSELTIQDSGLFGGPFGAITQVRSQHHWWG